MNVYILNFVILQLQKRQSFADDVASAWLQILTTNKLVCLKLERDDAHRTLPERRDHSPCLQKRCRAAWANNLILFNLYLVFIR